MSKGFGWSLVLVLGLVPAVWAQSSGGNVYGTVVDQSGAALPGATVTIASSELGGTRSTVTETPVVDLKKVGTSTTLTKDELSEVPQGRDPWAILKNVPGVLVDRVSIAGSE